MVEEHIRGVLKLNQPAGHLEDNESLIDAVIRETQEETAWQFIPEFLVGIYRWRNPENGTTYMRYCFGGQAGAFLNTPLDADIHRAVWLDYDTLIQRKAELRSPLALQSVQDYLQGKRFPLELLID